MSSEDTCSPGGVQHLPADSTPRQYRHHLHDPGAHAALVTRPDRVQGQQHCFRDAVRVRRAVLPHQVLVDRQRPQPLQVSTVPPVLPGDHRRGLS